MYKIRLCIYKLKKSDKMSSSPPRFLVQPGLLSLTLNPGAPLMRTEVGVRALIVATRHFKYSSKAFGLAAWMEEKDVGTGFSQDLPSQGSQHFYHPL